MKKCTGVVVLTSLWLGAATAMASQPFTIADPESGAASVVIAPTASETTRTNAEELTRIIEQIRGHRPLIATAAAAAERAICVGTAAEFPDAPR